MKYFVILIVIFFLQSCVYEDKKTISFFEELSCQDSVILSGFELNFEDAIKGNVNVSDGLVDSIYINLKNSINLYNDSVNKNELGKEKCLHIEKMSKQFVLYRNNNNQRICFIQCFCGCFDKLSLHSIDFKSDTGSCLFSLFYYIDKDSCSVISVSSYE